MGTSDGCATLSGAEAGAAKDASRLRHRGLGRVEHVGRLRADESAIGSGDSRRRAHRLVGNWVREVADTNTGGRQQSLLARRGRLLGGRGS